MKYPNNDKMMEFISFETGVKLEELHLETTLFSDLGLDGISATEFFANFSNQFNVDMSNFHFDKYFGYEGYSFYQLFFLPLLLLHNLFLYILNNDLHLQAGLIPITIEHLLKVADIGKWFDPEEKGSKKRGQVA